MTQKTKDQIMIHFLEVKIQKIEEAADDLQVMIEKDSKDVSTDQKKDYNH